MESALLGLVLDSSSILTAERRKQAAASYIEELLRLIAVHPFT